MVSSNLSKLKMGTRYEISCFRDNKIVWTVDTNNMVVHSGLEYVMGKAFGEKEDSELYAGLCTSAAVLSTDTMSSHGFIEYLGTASSHRPRAVFADTGLSDNKWTYTAMDIHSMAMSKAILKGAFLTDNANKGEDRGMLYGVAPFQENKEVNQGDLIIMTITTSVEG